MINASILRLHITNPNDSLTTLTCGFNKAAGSTATMGCVPNFRACCGETIVDGADRLKNVKGERRRDEETRDERDAPYGISRWLRASLISVGRCCHKRRHPPWTATVVPKLSLSLSFSVSVVILIVRAEYLVLVVFISEIGVDNVKGFYVRYRIFNSLRGSGLVTFRLYE